MLFFALFTAGYILGVLTALAIFSPKTNELAEQEKDAVAPIQSLNNVAPVSDSGAVSSPVLTDQLISN